MGSGIAGIRMVDRVDNFSRFFSEIIDCLEIKDADFSFYIKNGVRSIT